MFPAVQPMFWPIGNHDPYWDKVVLLSGFNGTDGSTSTSDESPAQHGAGFFSGSSQISTARAKFGVSSLLCNGNSVTWGDSDDWWFGTGEVTIECFFYATGVSGAQFLVTQWNALGGGGLGWALWLDNSTLRFNISTTGSDNLNDVGGGTVVANQWNCACYDRDSSKQRLYLNGTTVATSSTSRNFANVSTPVSIGADSNGGFFGLGGNVDDVRITKGKARYVTDTGYTVTTVAFPRG